MDLDNEAERQAGPLLGGLQINQALRKYFPNSPFVGNCILLQIDDQDIIDIDRSQALAELAGMNMGYCDASSISDHNRWGVTTRRGGYDHAFSPIPWSEL